MSDNVVINKVKPVVDKVAIEAAERDLAQRKAAIQREEDARRARDEAVRGQFLRAPDREPTESVAKATDAFDPTLIPQVPAPPFTAVGLDETALRTYEDYGVKLSPSTQQAMDNLSEEREFLSKRGGTSGGVLADSERAAPENREPDDVQTQQTSQTTQSSEPNRPNQPDQPTDPNQPNESKARKAAAAGDPKKK